MQVREVFLQHLNRTVKLGRKAPVAKGPRLKLRNYLRDLPPPPATFDFSGPALPAISQMYDNDSLGDCVIACMQHTVGVLTANATGTPVIFSDADTIANYSAIGGYVPGDPSSDQGCDEVTALNFWQQHGIQSHYILGSLDVDPTNPLEVRTALYYFENLIYGIPLPDRWLTNPQPGFVWDAAQPDPRNGHCVGGVAAKPGAIQVMTWGFTGWITDAAHAVDVQELHVVLSKESINAASQKAGNGIAWPQLIADWDAIGGNLPVPSPSPAPSPAPTPAPPAPAPSPNKLTRLEQFYASLAPTFGCRVSNPVNPTDAFSVR